MDALPVDGIEVVIETAVKQAIQDNSTLISRVPAESLSFTIVGFAQATGIGATTLYEDAKSGKLKTHLLGVGKRKKRLVLREDGVDYLRSFPVDREACEEKMLASEERNANLLVGGTE